MPSAKSKAECESHRENKLAALAFARRTPITSPTLDAWCGLPKPAPVPEAPDDADRGREFGAAAPASGTTDVSGQVGDADHWLARTQATYLKDACGATLDRSDFGFIAPQWFAGAFRWRAQAVSGYACVERVPVLDLSKAIPLPEKVFEPESVVSTPGPMSLGSVGHPLACGEPCKYAWRKKGCKDGVSCDRCHFCEWSRYAKRRPRTQTSFAPGMCSPCEQ
mmetsp:Transcript_9879/g.26024  ORF Transcript_9879/g.26024 Transcript_9879/m.26024 type:complete len:222 (-) Transcript_9879:41-706(-)